MSLNDDDDCTCVASRRELFAAVEKKTSARPWLVVVRGEATVGKMYRLTDKAVLGRAPDADVRLDEEGVSRRHAMLVCTPEGKVEIVDLESRNGTFVNGERVMRRALSDGDKIEIGNISILKFSYQDAVDESLQKNLYESATRDALTKVDNKRTFLANLSREFAYGARHRRPLSLVLFDVDHFKKINDGFGHLAGDYVLQTLAETVGRCLRTEDALARYGGEEFAILLRDTDMNAARDCADRVRATVEARAFAHGANRIPVTISLGVATLIGASHATPEALIAAADAELYRAKRSGRNRVCCEGDRPLGSSQHPVALPS